MATEKFHIPITQEGETGPIRGKVPTSMVNAMGMDDGDVLVIEVNRKTIVGGHAATGKEAAKYRAEIVPRGRTGGATSSGSKNKGKKVGKSKPSPKKETQPAKKTKKVVKSNKRKTSVSYDTDRPKKKKLLSKKKKRAW